MERLNRHQSKLIELGRIMHIHKIYKKDIKESFTRSSKPGGQNVNKVSTCVILEHIPTGIKVRCQEERTQIQNRYRALHLLVHKIKEYHHQKKLAEIDRYEKMKRQSRTRPDYLKEEILKKKHEQSKKKKMREKIRTLKPDDLT